MGIALQSHIYFCIANGQPAFLDLQEDRYFCLTEAASAAFLRCIAAPASEPLCEELRRQKLFNRLFVEFDAPTSQIKQTQANRPTASAIGGMRKETNALWLMLALVSYWRAGRRLNTLGLEKAVHRIERQKRANEGQTEHAALAPVISAFLQAKRLIATHNQCLRWSIAMVDYLAIFKIHPELVMGVKMSPFGAHAWVQQDGVILSDSVDNVIPFTPILVV